jgi:hypothetical protein
MHVHVSLTFSSISSTTPPPTTHPHRSTPLLGAGHARNDLQRHRQFEALIDARFGPAQERARRPRRPQGPGVTNAPHTQTSPKPHTRRTVLSTTTTTNTTVKDRTAGHRGQGGREAHLGRGRRASGGSRGARAHLSLLKVAPARNSGWLLRRGLRLRTQEQSPGRSTCHVGAECQQLRSRTLLTPRYFCPPQDRGNAGIAAHTPPTPPAPAPAP